MVIGLPLIYNNAIFISDDIKINVPDRTLTQIYNDGYVNKPDRKENFLITMM